MKASTVDQGRSKSQKARQDDSVMGTNNSSIVSKRSVERLYYPEPHFYRYFVKKPSRRSPLINRGYWLRMCAVEQVIKQFLEETSKNHKIVLNLGCGYDPLPFQWLSKDRIRGQKCQFIDVDFPELMAKKSDVIVNTPQLRNMLGPYERPSTQEGLYLCSEQYLVLGCDLENITKLNDLLANKIDRLGSSILCIAEVSVTYMNVNAADVLIRWGAQYKDIRFCLLEQYLPDGPEHPFAQNMIKHFNGLQTPLKSVHAYPRLVDQERRFLQLGWSAATAKSLWDVWNDPELVPSEQRLALNAVEPFDEWEEFVLFASHYFLLLADRGILIKRRTEIDPLRGRFGAHLNGLGNKILVPHYVTLPKSKIRRFGALVPLSPKTIGHHGGLGAQSRLASTEVYSLPGEIQPDPPNANTIGPRMCHTITSLDHKSLLVGGRTSPGAALQDCWLLQEDRWRRVHDLPIPLYRHCATQITFAMQARGALIYGGKTGDNEVSGQWLLWRQSEGWVQVLADNGDLHPRFGAAIAATGWDTGVLLGGMMADGTVLDEIWEWTLKIGQPTPSIEMRRATASWLGTQSVIRRMGAFLEMSSIGLLLIGGVISDTLAQEKDIILLSKKYSEEKQASEWQWNSVNSQVYGQRPLLIGHSTLASNQIITVLGGGAVCFSFGIYQNTNLITLSTNNAPGFSVLNPDLSKSEPASNARLAGRHMDQPPYVWPLTINVEATPITRVCLDSPGDFERVLTNGRPVIITGINLGLCRQEWTLDTLKAKIGEDRTVVVHEAIHTQMNFQQKNFQYNKKLFSIFADEIAGGARQYLRSLASEKPAEKPANFWTDFPELASDFVLPPILHTVKQNMHSSVLRISGAVNMWLHYDVMANVLCQVRGTKRLILYPPSDVSCFSIPPGASSSPINCFEPHNAQNPSLGSTHPYEVLLEGGDILFIPPLWLHTASPEDNVSISVNVFFRSLDSGYALGRDVYGNRDVQAYEKGRKEVDKIAKSFDKLPADMGRFYLERLADELKEKALQLRL